MTDTINHLWWREVGKEYRKKNNNFQHTVSQNKHSHKQCGNKVQTFLFPSAIALKIRGCSLCTPLCAQWTVHSLNCSIHTKYTSFSFKWKGCPVYTVRISLFEIPGHALIWGKQNTLHMQHWHPVSNSASAAHTHIKRSKRIEVAHIAPYYELKMLNSYPFLLLLLLLLYQLYWIAKYVCGMHWMSGLKLPHWDH